MKSLPLVRNDLHFCEPQFPTTGRPCKDVREIIRVYFGIAFLLVIFPDIGHDGRVPEQVCAHVLSLHGVWVRTVVLNSIPLQLLCKFGLRGFSSVRTKSDPVVSDCIANELFCSSLFEKAFSICPLAGC